MSISPKRVRAFPASLYIFTRIFPLAPPGVQVPGGQLQLRQAKDQLQGRVPAPEGGVRQVRPRLRRRDRAAGPRRHPLHGPQHELLRGRLPAGPPQEDVLLHHHVLPSLRPLCLCVLDQLPGEPGGDSRQDDPAGHHLSRPHQHF